MTCILIGSIIFLLVTALCHQIHDNPVTNHGDWVKWQPPIEPDNEKALRQYIETVNYYGLNYGDKI